MKIGIFSDIHDRTEHLEPAMQEMHLLGCTYFIFLGDCTTPNSFSRLLKWTRDLPLDAVPGNNDDELRAMQQLALASPAARLHGEHVIIMRGGLRISLSHYPQPALKAARSGTADVALYGHTHIAEQDLINHCLIANPGELQGRTGHLGFAVLDTETRRIELHKLKYSSSWRS